MGTPGPNREDSLSPVGVSKLLFPNEDPPVILSSADVTNLSGSGGVSSAAILDLWVARSLVTDDALYDVSLALLSQPLLGKHLKCITDWTGQVFTYIQFKNILTNTLNTLKLMFIILESN